MRFYEKPVLCSRTISKKKNMMICRIMWIIKKEGQSTKRTGLEKSYQKKEGADEQEQGQECCPFVSKGYFSFSSSQDKK